MFDNGDDDPLIADEDINVVAAAIRTAEQRGREAERLEWSYIMCNSGELLTPSDALAIVNTRDCDNWEAAKLEGREAERREVEAEIRSVLDLAKLVNVAPYRVLQGVMRMLASRSAPAAETPHILRLSPRETEEFDRIMSEPFVPNEALREAAQRFQEDIDSGRLVIRDAPAAKLKYVETPRPGCPICADGYQHLEEHCLASPAAETPDAPPSATQGVRAGTPPAGASERGGNPLKVVGWLSTSGHQRIINEPARAAAKEAASKGGDSHARPVHKAVDVTSPGSASAREAGPGDLGLWLHTPSQPREIYSRMDSESRVVLYPSPQGAAGEQPRYRTVRMEDEDFRGVTWTVQDLNECVILCDCYEESHARRIAAALNAQAQAEETRGE